MTLQVIVETRPTPAKLTGEVERNFKVVNGKVVNSLLDFIEQSQIKSYTATGKPSQPAGTKYRRTFELQQSSQRLPGRITAHEFNGQWRTDIGHARFVIGLKNDQAAIHRGRWKPLEQVRSETDSAAPAIYDDKFNEVFK